MLLEFLLDPHPSVSIVIPAYNAGPYIADAVRSVLAQTYKPIELIVIDDGSTDDTIIALTEFDSSIQLHRQANAGQSAALNKGWLMSKGTLLGYLSADDLLRPGAVEHVAAALVKHPNTILAYPDFGLIDERTRRIGIVHTLEYSEAALFRDLVCLPGPGALFRREALQSSGGWNPAFRQIPDLEFYLRLALHGGFVRVPEVLADFRVHSKSTTYRPTSDRCADEPIRLVNEFFERNDIPTRLRTWEKAMAANAYLLCGMLHGQSGRLKMALHRFAQALRRSPRMALSVKAACYALRIARMNFFVRADPGSS